MESLLRVNSIPSPWWAALELSESSHKCNILVPHIGKLFILPHFFISVSFSQQPQRWHWSANTHSKRYTQGSLQMTPGCQGALAPQITFFSWRKPYFPGTAMTFPFLQGGDKAAAACPWIKLLDRSADVWLCATWKMSLPAGSSKQVINARLRNFPSYVQVLLFAAA